MTPKIARKEFPDEVRCPGTRTCRYDLYCSGRFEGRIRIINCVPPDLLCSPV
jgi:hypothetical protein